VPWPVGFLMRFAAVLDGLTGSAAEQVGALEASWAGRVAAVVVGEAKIHTRHFGRLGLWFRRSLYCTDDCFLTMLLR
jgi:hypothetical protein